jgi:2'-5' RNA ligase
MKFCIALLTDYRIHNFARKLALQLDRDYGAGMDAALLPQHVTLAPVFTADNLAVVETYFDQLAADLTPVELHFSRLELKLTDCSPSGVIWLQVDETPLLSQLKQRLSRDMAQRQWQPDILCGAEFEFHSTVTLGKLTASRYREIFAALPDKKLDLDCVAKELALFCPVQTTDHCQNYFTYKILPFR